MPELPEIETICQGLKNDLVGKKITLAHNYRKDLRIIFPIDFKSKLINQYIIDVKRRSKYILIELSDFILIIHLGMSGRLVYHKYRRSALIKHDHAVFIIGDGELVYNDPRRFGLITFANYKNLENHKLFRSLGPEPFDDNFNITYLKGKLAKKNIPIKTALMDNNIVVGIGNIYASESLFRSAILPTRLASSINENELKRLINSIMETLRDALNSGGSSLKDFVNASGEAGYFQNQHNVYNKQNCKICNSDIIKIKQAGRTSFYCQICQK